MEQESLIKSDDSHYCKEILRRVIKHDDPFKESKAKQLRRYIGSNSRIIYYVNYDIVSDIFSKGDCWVDDNVYGKRLDRRFFVQELIDISSKNSYDNHPYVGECYTLACLNCLDEQLVRNLFTLYKKQAEEVHNLSEDDILKERSRELEKFWGHFITNKLEQVKEEYAEYYDTHPDIYGFKVAYHDCEREAVAFFYKRLEEQNTSEEVKLNLLIEAALYSMSGTNDVDTTIFCLQKAMDNGQHLERFLKKCNVLHMLIGEGYFDTVCQLFSVWSQFYSVENYSTLLSITNWESSKSRANLLDNITELGKERFWRELPSFDCGNSSYLLKGFAENNCNKVFKELWQAYSSDQCRYVFSSGKGEVICNLLYLNGNRELLKEFLLHYTNNNEAVLKDIDSFIDNLDSALNSYVSTDDASLDKINRDWVVHDEIEKTLPKLIEALDCNTQNIQVQNTSIEVDSISAGESSKEHIH